MCAGYCVTIPVEIVRLKAKGVRGRERSIRFTLYVLGGLYMS
jgi:hypothetical protein